MLTVRNNKKILSHIVPLTLAVVPFATASALLISPRETKADVTTYATSKRVYKVGVLLIDSTADENVDGIITAAEAAKGPENPDPHLFYIADQRTDIKPSGWELENPLAPGTVTSDIYNRWSAPAGRDPGHPYTVGQKVTKDMAAYWEVSLTKASVSELIQYDVLFITNHRDMRLTPQDREKLRKVVDAGGVVWLDDCGRMRFRPDGRFFLDELQFQGGTGGPAGTPGPALYQPTHPLINSPYTLSYNDILTLGDKGYGNYYLTTFAANAVTVNDVVLTAPNKETLTTIIGNRAAADVNLPNTALPYVSAGVYGSGAVIVTSADIGCGINDYSGGFNGLGGNSGAYSGKNLQAANIEDLKFLYNAISWGGSNNTVRRNNRRSASSTSAVTAPLNPSFDFVGNLADAVNSSSAPLIAQGIMYVSGVDGAGNVTLRAYDTIPNRDFDSDGNYDDGLPDLIKGKPYDELWRWQGPAAGGVQPSAPVLATITTTAGQSGDVILLTLGDGTLVSLNARPLDPATRRILPVSTGFVSNTPETTGIYAAAANGVAPSPVFFGNKIYVVESKGVVRCVSAANFATLWKSTELTANSPTPINYDPTGTPTLGLNRLVVNKVRDTNSPSRENTIAGNTNESTNDIMLYVPVQDATAGASKVLPYWLGARGEGTKDSNVTGAGGNAATMRLRPASTNNDQYLISKGGNGFITPSVRLYADVTVNGVLYSREENFAAGRAVYPLIDPFFTTGGNTYGDTWTVGFQDSAIDSNFYSGLLNITLNTTGASNITRVLAVADYDLVYVPKNGTAPPYLQNSPGHRNANPLSIPRATGLDTVSLAPNDLLLYGANQTGNGTNAIQRGAIFAMQEREFSLSASRLRWRYLLHDFANDAQVGTVTVPELPALRNRLIFSPTDPLGEVSLIQPPAAPYEALTNAQIVGSPITTNDGITYALARATSAVNNNETVTVLMAFQTVPQITLDLGVSIQDGSAVTVSQWDPLSSTVVSTSGDPNDRTRVDVDYKTGRLTIADFGALNNGENLLSASSSFVVSYNPKSAAGATLPDTKIFSPYGPVQNVATGSPEDVLTGSTGTTATSGGFTPLLWYYVLPGTPKGSPTKIGDQIFLSVDVPIPATNTVVSKVLAVDADPASNDPSVRLRSGEQVYNVSNNIRITPTVTKPVSRNHVRWDANIAGGTGGPPSGGEGVVAVNSALGTSAYSEGLTVIAENTRVLEVNGDGAAVLAINGTTEQTTVGGSAPVYLPNGLPDPAITTRGRVVVDSKPFNAPQSVRRLSASDYLLADTGNNRVLRMDRGGILRWSVERLNDPYGILAPGDPLTLNTPTDVLTRQLSTFNAGNRVGFENHYLIADSGNGRVIDVVDYFDLDGNPRPPVAGGASTGVVVWSTRTKSRDGENLAYHNLQLIAGNDGPSTGKPILVASVGNSSVAAGNNTDPANSTGGSLVQLDYNPYNTGFVLVNPNTGAVDQIKYYWPLDPTSASNTEPANNGKPLLAINELRFYTGGVVSSTQRLSGPTYFEQIALNIDATPQPESVYMVVDAQGVYLCVVNRNPMTGKSYFDVVWQFRQADYDRINYDPSTAVGLRRHYIPTTLSTKDLPRFAPSSVKRLANGNFLITNSAAGPSRLYESGQFTGEVFEVKLTPVYNGGTTIFDIDPATGLVVSTAGGNTRYADFSAPRILLGTDGPPRLLNRQQMGRDANGATLTEQPRSADRL